MSRVTLDLGLVFFVTAGIFGIAAADHAVRDADDHAEPQNGQALDDQEETEEHPLEGWVETDGIVQAEVWAEHVREGVWRVGRDELACRARVAAVGEVEGELVVDGPADDRVDDMAGEEPGTHEQTEADVAGSLVFEVLEDFGSLSNVSQWSIFGHISI